MTFDYDPIKSSAKATKHGVDFDQAQMLCYDPDLLEITACTESEPRFLVIGRLVGRHWSAVITYRQNSIRLISVRRSRPEEIALYES